MVIFHRHFHKVLSCVRGSLGRRAVCVYVDGCLCMCVRRVRLIQ